MRALALMAMVVPVDALADGVVSPPCSSVATQVQVASAGRPPGNPDGLKVVLKHAGGDPMTVACITESHSKDGRRAANTTLVQFWKPGEMQTCLPMMHFSTGHWFAVVGRTNELYKSVPNQERTACGSTFWQLIKEKEDEVIR